MGEAYLQRSHGLLRILGKETDYNGAQIGFAGPQAQSIAGSRMTHQQTYCLLILRKPYLSGCTKHTNAAEMQELDCTSSALPSLLDLCTMISS